MSQDLTRQELEAAHCWEADDHVPRQPEMTTFRRRLRSHQARWRESNGHPIGTQPIAPRPGGTSPRLVGSRLPLDYGRNTGATFLTNAALEAARERTRRIEPHQSFDHQRLWADLLSSAAMTFNVFGDVAADHRTADAVVRALWPDAPGTVHDVRFAYSPGWLDPAFTNNLRAFDAAFVLGLDDGTSGVVAIDIKYHERVKRELPRPENLSRYLEVHERSGIFRPEAIDARQPSDLAEMWLEHLLLLSMLQHESGRWNWGRYVVIHPAGNASVTDACARYRDLLLDHGSFASVTLEELLDAGALPATSTSKLRRRYLPA